VDAGLAGEEEHHQGGEEHHVAGQREEDKKTDAMKALAGTVVLTLPVVVASATAASGGAPVDRRLTADSWFFPFNFRWGARKGNGHWRPRNCCTEITLTLGWTHGETCEMVVLYTTPIDPAQKKNRRIKQG
jgi:hypothetical protein